MCLIPQQDPDGRGAFSHKQRYLFWGVTSPSFSIASAAWAMLLRRPGSLEPSIHPSKRQINSKANINSVEANVEVVEGRKNARC